MARVWYCVTCGYEVSSKGRCFNCGEKLTASALPELEPRAEDDEVGYRLDGWDEADRGRLIVALNDLGLLHRFEEEELVVDAADEERVDDLVTSIADGIQLDDDPGSAGDGEGADGSGALHSHLAPTMANIADVDDDEAQLVDAPERVDDVPAGVLESVALLVSAASRLHADPTDMQADGDVAEASASVFILDSYDPLDSEEWSAVGRVTRKLLALLGAEEALEDDIRGQAAILEKLLAPIAVAAGGGADAAAGGAGGVRTVYELPDWMPEQRAQLGVLLDQASIAYGWDGDELLVPSDREDDAEALFGDVDGIDDEDDEGDETRYDAVAELFAAAGRLSGDPTDGARQSAVVDWFGRSDGPPLLGMDDVDWYRIVNRGKSLVALIEGEGDFGRIQSEAEDLHELLRAVV